MFDDLMSMHQWFDYEEVKEQAFLAENDGFSPEIKKKTLTAVLLSLLIGNLMVSNVCIVLPHFIGNS